MRIAVVGAGGVGGYFGARLASHGEEVHFVARGTHLAAMANHGMQVRSVFGDFSVPPQQMHATDDVAQIGAVDVVLFTVKTFDTDAAAALLPPLLGPDTAVISLQNGIDNEERLASAIGASHVVGGVAYIFAGIAEPGVIRHSGGPARIVFGEMSGESSARLERFLAVCQAAGIDAALVPDIRTHLWQKFAFICAQAGLTAASRTPIGVIRETPSAWSLFRRILEEVAEVARAEGVSLADDVKDRQLAMAQSLEPTAYSSLYDDLVGGRRVELDGLHGELVRRAERAQVDVPVSSVIHAVLQAAVNGRSAAEAT
jgi:2-dehydropantoate 2-reductase